MLTTVTSSFGIDLVKGEGSRIVARMYVCAIPVASMLLGIIIDGLKTLGISLRGAPAGLPKGFL
jgi:hypothetical protein